MDKYPGAHDLKRTFFEAAASGNLKTVRSMLEDYNVRVNMKRADDWTALHIASDGGHADIVGYLLSIDEIDVNACTDHLATPLHLASERGYEKIIRLLISAGADVSAWDGMDGTPLYRAVDEDHLEVARILLEAGSDINDGRSWQGTPLDCVNRKISAKRDDFLRLFREVVPGQIATADFFDAIEHNDILSIRKLIDNVDVNARFKTKHTALSYALCTKNIEIIELIIKAGADLTAPFENNGSLLQCCLTLDTEDPLRRVTEEVYQKHAPEHYFSVFCTTNLTLGNT